AIGHPRLVGCVVDRRRRPGQGAGQPGGGDGHADHGGGETAPPPQGAAGKGRDAAGEQIHGELLGGGPAPWGTEPGGSIVGGTGVRGEGSGRGRRLGGWGDQAGQYRAERPAHQRAATAPARASRISTLSPSRASAEVDEWW